VSNKFHHRPLDVMNFMRYAHTRITNSSTKTMQNMSSSNTKTCRLGFPMRLELTSVCRPMTRAFSTINDPTP